jgi:D-glucosaminate-6-phosphate ammonia-lyase
VMLNELHDKVGERLATLLRCEAAMVSSGAASALTLGTAGVLAGTDRDKIAALPNLDGMKSEVIIQKAHRFGYDRAIRNCGVRLVEVETREDVDRAVNDKTAMMLFLNNANSDGQIKHQEFVELGKKHAVPTMIDCAADVPPVDNLWKYTAMGFDLVVFSGGKGIRGPQSAGLMLGRKDLIAAARANASPNGSALGRGMKVNKEEIVGMLVAIETYLNKDHDKETRDFEQRAETIRKAVTSVPGVTAEVYVPEVANHVPHVRISWDAEAKKLSARDVVTALQEGEPSIRVRGGRRGLEVGVWMMKPGEDKIVAARLRRVLEGKDRRTS